MVDVCTLVCSVHTRSTLQLLAQDTGGRGDGAGTCARGCAPCLSWDSLQWDSKKNRKVNTLVSVLNKVTIYWLWRISAVTGAVYTLVYLLTFSYIYLYTVMIYFLYLYKKHDILTVKNFFFLVYLLVQRHNMYWLSRIYAVTGACSARLFSRLFGVDLNKHRQFWKFSALVYLLYIYINSDK